MIDGVPILGSEYIIPFKAKAWLDLTERRAGGEHVDGKNIRKHKNDVFRMAVLISEENRIEINGEVKRDMQRFLESMKSERIDLKSLGIAEKKQEELIRLMEICYFAQSL